MVYCRVSSQAQKPDLVNQRRTLEKYTVARGFVSPEFVQEIGGGLNFRRPKFLEILSRIQKREISKLVVAHRDRLCRFGFELIEEICKENGCVIEVLNHEQLSPEQEMVQDLMTIVHCFSSRLYGLRNYRKSLQEALKTKC